MPLATLGAFPKQFPNTGCPPHGHSPSSCPTQVAIAGPLPKQFPNAPWGWPWSGQRRWEVAWGVVLGWPSAFESLLGSARGVGNLCWEIVWEMPLLGVGPPC